MSDIIKCNVTHDTFQTINKFFPYSATGFCANQTKLVKIILAILAAE